MKICVTSNSEAMEGLVDARFGRCGFFIIYDTKKGEHEVFENVGKTASSGAGIRAAQAIVKRGVKVVLTGNIGPNALQVLSQAGVKVFTGLTGKVSTAIEEYERGELAEGSHPTVRGHFGRTGGHRPGTEV